MRVASPLDLVSAVLAEPPPESKLPATEHKSQPTRLSVSCEISFRICTAPDLRAGLRQAHGTLRLILVCVQHIFRHRSVFLIGVSLPGVLANRRIGRGARPTCRLRDSPSWLRKVAHPITKLPFSACRSPPRC